MQAVRKEEAGEEGDDMNLWFNVKTSRPPCSRDPFAPGTPVLIWPRDPEPDQQSRVDGFCYYGRRATGKATFYLYGAEIIGVTHWQPMPEGPKAKK